MNNTVKWISMVPKRATLRGGLGTLVAKGTGDYKNDVLFRPDDQVKTAGTFPGRMRNDIPGLVVSDFYMWATWRDPELIPTPRAEEKTSAPLTPTGEAQLRKERPIARGVLDYFPDAVAEVANVSRVANEQHNPGQPMHWSFHKSTDHADCILRHLVDRGTLDSDKLLHSAKVAWRALALLQTELEKASPELHARREAARKQAASK